MAEPRLHALRLPEPRGYTQKTAAAAITVAVHVLLLAAVLMHRTYFKPQERETVLILPSAMPRSPAVQTPRHMQSPHPESGRRAHNRAIVPPLPPSLSGKGQWETFHGLLFDCEPGSRDLSSAEGRARCDTVTGRMTPNGSLDYARPIDRARDAARWARAQARKAAPALLPCASPQGIGISLGTLICLGKGAIDGGFDLDAQPGYFDKPETFHLLNNGDPKPLRQPVQD